jgi:stage IV sporulation protein FB
MNPFSPPTTFTPSPIDRPPNSLSLGRWFGIGVFLEFHLFIPLLLIVFSTGNTGTTGVLVGLAIFVILFASVLLHEFGHALAARRCGVSTRYITLGMLGGVAYLEGRPLSPKQDLFVTIAGPAVNVVLWAIFSGLAAAGAEPYTETAAWLLAAASFTATMNVYLLLFNLIPAWPMDGGRVLNAFLRMRFHPAKAMAITCRVAMVAAVGLGCYAAWRFYHGQMAILTAVIAYSVFTTAKQMLQSIQQMSAGGLR